MKDILSNNDLLPSYNKETKIANVKYRNFTLQIDNNLNTYSWKYALLNHEYYHVAKYDIKTFTLNLDCSYFKLIVNPIQLTITIPDKPTITFLINKDIDITIDQYNIIIKKEAVFIKHNKVKKFYYNGNIYENNLNKDHFRIFNFLTMSFYRKTFTINICLIKYTISNNFTNSDSSKHKIVLDVKYKNSKLLIIKPILNNSFIINYKWPNSESKKIKYLANILHEEDHMLVKYFSNQCSKLIPYTHLSNKKFYHIYNTVLENYVHVIKIIPLLI
jgi:hypothetical protein